MITLTSLLAVALMGQSAPASIRVAPETLAWLRKGGGVNTQLAEALLDRPATIRNIEPKEFALLSRPDLTAKALAVSRERATRQLRVGSTAESSPSTLLSDGHKPVLRTILANGDVLYDFTFSSGLLVPVSFEAGFDNEADARAALSKIVLSKISIPKEAQTIVAGRLNQVALPSGRKLWGGGDDRVWSHA